MDLCISCKKIQKRVSSVKWVLAETCLEMPLSVQLGQKKKCVVAERKMRWVQGAGGHRYKVVGDRDKR